MAVLNDSIGLFKLKIRNIEKEANITDIKRRYDTKELSNEDYNGIIKMDYDEDKYFSSKNIKSTNHSITKYESIWSMYSDKKINVMPKYNIDEAESYSTFIWNNSTNILTITTSSPDGDEETSIKITSVTNEANKVNYTGKLELSKITISINKLTKWIEVTFVENGKSSYEYHKIN